MYFSYRLIDVVNRNSTQNGNQNANQNAKLYLVFEYLDLDLKRYMDSIKESGGMSPAQVKVGVRC